jgi:hypothetical protein
VDREAEVDYRRSEAIPPFVNNGNLLPITDTQSVSELAKRQSSRESERAELY